MKSEDIETAVDAAFDKVLPGWREGFERGEAFRDFLPPQGKRNAIRAQYEACAAEGLTIMETASRLGKTYAAVSFYAGRNSIEFKRERPGRKVGK